MSDFTDRLRRLPEDTIAALSFFSRLPVRTPPDIFDLTRIAGGWPLAGLLIAVGPAIIVVVNHWLGIPVLVTAFLAIAAGIAMTGALHEDGLADTFDGLGGRGKARRLAIMRDSHLGTYRRAGARARGAGEGLGARRPRPPSVARCAGAAWGGNGFARAGALALERDVSGAGGRHGLRGGPAGYGRAADRATLRAGGGSRARHRFRICGVAGAGSGGARHRALLAARQPAARRPHRRHDRRSAADRRDAAFCGIVVGFDFHHRADRHHIYAHVRTRRQPDHPPHLSDGASRHSSSAASASGAAAPRENSAISASGC